MTDRETTAGELTPADYGHRVTFRRPSHDSGERPVILGKLVNIAEATLYRGSMPKPAVTLTVALPSRYGSTSQSYGPMPVSHRVEVGGRWIERGEPNYEPEPVFSPAVKRVRVEYIGEPFDGVVEDIPVGDFYLDENIRRRDANDSRVSYTYCRLGQLQQIKGALWGGRWFLIEKFEETEDFMNPTRTTYSWPASAAAPPPTT